MRIVAIIVLVIIFAPILYYLWSKYSVQMKGALLGLLGLLIGLFAVSFVFSAFKVAMGAGDENPPWCDVVPGWLCRITFRQVFVTELIILGSILGIGVILVVNFFRKES